MKDMRCPFCAWGILAKAPEAKAREQHCQVMRCDRCATELEVPDNDRLVPDRRPVRPGYEQLATILDDALDQAQAGKGHERHAHPAQPQSDRPYPILPFQDQRMVRICEALGSPQHAIGQALKKLEEALVLPMPARRRELLGAIIYAAGAVLVEDRAAEREVGAG